MIEIPNMTFTCHSSVCVSLHILCIHTHTIILQPCLGSISRLVPPGGPNHAAGSPRQQSKTLEMLASNIKIIYHHAQPHKNGAKSKMYK